MFHKLLASQQMLLNNATGESKNQELREALSLAGQYILLETTKFNIKRRQ